ncbi:hypothetical protein Tcan_12989 [Toxocara canis]|uniref:Uncharacterized protein n=1 Tax=Toxocara canis TaxID=6265 RepID=A0A0B2UT24_TOXCA|nr:hypothetical protein Tcan_12989 [Toxocara canis]
MGGFDISDVLLGYIKNYVGLNECSNVYCRKQTAHHTPIYEEASFRKCHTLPTGRYALKEEDNRRMGGFDISDVLLGYIKNYVGLNECSNVYCRKQTAHHTPIYEEASFRKCHTLPTGRYALKEEDNRRMGGFDISDVLLGYIKNYVGLNECSNVYCRKQTAHHTPIYEEASFRKCHTLPHINVLDMRRVTTPKRDGHHRWCGRVRCRAGEKYIRTELEQPKARSSSFERQNEKEEHGSTTFSIEYGFGILISHHQTPLSNDHFFIKNRLLQNRQTLLVGAHNSDWMGTL